LVATLDPSWVFQGAWDCVNEGQHEITKTSSFVENTPHEIVMIFGFLEKTPQKITTFNFHE
jgi:hypothetical protein